jgi:hypothetical protein
LWNSRRPRIKFKTLQLRIDKGGFALPCIEDYYTAAQLRPLVCWCNPEYSAKWKDLRYGHTERVRNRHFRIGNLWFRRVDALHALKRRVRGVRRT